MSDPDMREFFKGSNGAKKYNKQLKKDLDKRKPTFEPRVPFCNSTPPSTPAWVEPKPPIDVVKNGKYDEWEWMGNTFRPYYAGNLWLNCDASHIYYAFRDYGTNTITKVKRLDVKIDSDGNQYVENYVNKVLTKIYLDDALRAVYHTGLSPVQSPMSPSPTVSPQYFCEKRNPTIFTNKGVDYAFFHDGKFCVSRDGNHACWVRIDWNAKTADFTTLKPFNVKTRANGEKFVSVKQSDGTYEYFDMAEAVGKTFLKEPPSSGWNIVFKDGNISNCDADNLTWYKP